MAKRIKSIYQRQGENYCYFCGNTNCKLDIHHVFGASNRSISDEQGTYIYLCRTCHDNLHFKDEKTNNRFKARMEVKWCQHYHKTFDDFMEIFGENYV